MKKPFLPGEKRERSAILCAAIQFTARCGLILLCLRFLVIMKLFLSTLRGGRAGRSPTGPCQPSLRVPAPYPFVNAVSKRDAMSPATLSATNAREGRAKRGRSSERSSAAHPRGSPSSSTQLPFAWLPLPALHPSCSYTHLTWGYLVLSNLTLIFKFTNFIMVKHSFPSNFDGGGNSFF